MINFDYTKIEDLDILANLLLANCIENNCNVILLKGDLGSGKTNLTQRIGSRLNVETRVNSPTFVIAKKHKTKDKKFLNLCHYDLYRITNPEEIAEIGIYEEIEEKNNLVVIEWPEVIKRKLTKYIFVNLKTLGSQRIAKISTKKLFQKT